MTQGRDRLADWCGWVLVGALGLTPLMAWLGPMGFAVLPAIMGLLCLPAIRMTDEDRPILVVLLFALIWAAVSTAWSPFQPKSADRNLALKIALMLPLYWSAVCGARRAAPRLRSLALDVLAWGLAALSVVLLIEAATGAVIYRWLHEALYEPIRPDLAQKNVSQAIFALAVLWPIALLGRLRDLLDGVFAGLAALALLAVGLRFGADAPVLAVPLSLIVAGGMWRCPRQAPKILAGGAVALLVLTPGVFWLIRSWPGYQAYVDAMPLSWSMRVGYWSHALDWISDHPMRGWGLDASRTMGPGIGLHPHNGSLQLWLELGVIGAVAAALAWALAFLRLASLQRSLVAMGAAASMTTYLLFGALNFGVWQEWWLGLIAMMAVIAAAFRTEDLST